MKPYQNISGDSGVAAYEYGPRWIRIQFVHGGTYEYTSAGVGAANVAKMKRLADAGVGLSTFINTHPSVKNGFSHSLA